MRHDDWRDMETRAKAKTRHANVETEPIRLRHEKPCPDRDRLETRQVANWTSLIVCVVKFAHNVIRDAAGGQKCVIIMSGCSAAQAVECYVAYFHANNYKYSNKLLPQISQYFVIGVPGIERVAYRAHRQTHRQTQTRVTTYMPIFRDVYDSCEM